MKLSLWLGLLVAPLMVATTPAVAQSIPAELTGYNAIVVNFSETAGECNLKEEAMFADAVREKLAAIGIEENPESVVTVNLAISAKGFGIRNTSCTTQTVLSFNTLLTAENIVTDNQAVRDSVDRLKQFPVTLYRLGRFGTQAQVQPAQGGESTSSQKGVLEMIDQMVDKLAEERTG